MDANARRSTTLGIMGGLSLATVMTLLAWFNDRPEGSEILRTVINFFGSLPTLLFVVPLNMPRFFEILLFFVYWILVGGILGWLAGQKQFIPKMTALVMAVSLAVAHGVASVKWERELETMLRALGNWLTGGDVP